MIRAARTASLLVAFYLLTSAATANAECAWIVWSRTVFDIPTAPVEGIWAPVQTLDTHNACEDAATHWSNRVGGKKRTNEGSYVASFVCLPDTVDPRGLKGGGR